MKRVEDWPERLLAHVEARRETPFRWGQHDCCTFVADAVREIAGDDLMAALRGRYADARAASRVTREMGGIDAYLDARLPAIAPLTAQRGDVVMFEAADGPALGVVVGAQAAAAGPAGITWMPIDRWRRAWRVGRDA